MNDRNDYKVKGKMWALIALTSELRAHKMKCWHSYVGGFVRITINNGAELLILQDICAELGLTYDLF